VSLYFLQGSLIVVYVVKHRCFGRILWNVVNGPLVQKYGISDWAWLVWIYSWITQGNIVCFFLNAKAIGPSLKFSFSQHWRCVLLFCTVLFCKSLVYQLTLSLFVRYFSFWTNAELCVWNCRGLFQVRFHVLFHHCLIMG